MKKLLALLLAISACGVFAACAEKEPAKQSVQPSSPSTSQPSTPSVTPPVVQPPAVTVLTKEEWNEIVKFNIEQFSYVVSWGDAQMTYVFDGDYMEITRADGIRKLMYTKEGEEYYFYDNGGGWSKWPSTAEIYDEYFNEMRRMAALFVYEDFHYNAETDTYDAATISTTNTISNVSVKVQDGKVAVSKYTMNGMAYTVTLSYEPITLTLPNVEVMS